LYVDELDRVLKLKPYGSVEILQNGDDGVIFNPAGDSRHADLSVGLGSLRIKDGSLLDRHILSCIRWDEGGGLQEVSAKHLYKHHIISMFFDSLLQAKVCPVFQGRAGGGKNTITNLTGMLFEGKNFLITHFPMTDKYLDTMTVDRVYCGFDEYDSSKDKQESAFRSWCTRMWSSRRELYCTWDKSTRPTARGMGLSTNNNPVRDVATGQRQLMFNVLPRQAVAGEESYASLGGSIFPRFLAQRNAIWSEIVADLRAMVVALVKDDIGDKRTNFRMSDFVTLFLVGADVEGWGEEAREMLNEMAEMQVGEVADKHILVECMHSYLAEHMEERGIYKTQKQWQSELSDFYSSDRTTQAKLTASYLGKMLWWANKEIMVREFDMDVKEDIHKKQNTYAFWHRDTITLDDLSKEAAV
jgi:hypothetical protein